MGIPRNLGRLKNFNEKMPQSLTKGFLSERAHQVASYVGSPMAHWVPSSRVLTETGGDRGLPQSGTLGDENILISKLLLLPLLVEPRADGLGALMGPPGV